MARTSMRRCVVVAGVVVAPLALTGCGPAFSVTGFSVTGDSVAPISPRHNSAIDLTIKNPHFYPLRVSNVRVSIIAVDAPKSDENNSCSSADFALAPSSDASFTVPAGSTRSLSDLGIPAELWPTISMVESGVTQDGCLDATITLSYSADGAMVP